MQRIKTSDLDDAAYRRIAQLLLDGGVVCFPTDTLYGLAVDGTNPTSVRRLNRLKGRASETPVILLVDSVEAARRICRPPADFDAIAARFWPGPISFIMNARPDFRGPGISAAGSIALRWPRSEIVTRLLGEFGRPVTSTSANRTGRPVATSAGEVATALPGIDLLVDGGTLTDRAPSTLVDLTTRTPSVHREGVVRWSELSDFFGGRLERRSA
jgi:L-threonylcarbamoyladenylate synthase